MFIIMLRTIILYTLVVLIMRIMGKRQIGELQPFELVITIMISDLASLPMQDTRIPLIHGVIPIVTLLFLEILISLLQLKSETARLVISGKPSILINKGKIDIDIMRAQRLNLNDLLEEIRLKGYYNLEDIEFAILETSGQLSIIPKTELSNTTKKDLNVKCSQDTIPITLILDGKINYKNLKILGMDEKWLLTTLHSKNINSPKEVFIALSDSKGKFYMQTYKAHSKK
ncbi:Uncharacterized membrane protein YcaP, DUF421 family [Clostridium acidisoli DSM 12555]|uniref:Uncharacterized membrane protein YcaP, DUF421 family n=1 Tax=Clostridium acidisoli DSM 12555 TaxID=1121291 RepID=A0A1W1XIX8_9CLOT|nr:DUF421 domain-containing protein [Clostridium acidisoli]SMC23782.1 Uncharacterized membrane protein YcaP, DUF421 family [Clostridium acidisoli DSM 12555]